MATTEYYKDESAGEEWRWRVTAEDGTIIGRSTEGYTRKENAEKNLASLPGYVTDENVRVASADGDGPVAFYEDDQGRWRWRITASNGEIVHASVHGFDSREDAAGDLKALADAVEG